MKYTVNQLGRLAGISVRTLHYYDEINLLKPSFINPDNGYRYYNDQELLKLQQILFFRELEFPLEQIKKMITAKHFNTIEVLQDQKKLLSLQKKRTEKLIQTIVKTIQSLKGGEPMKNDDLFKSFNDDQIKQYQEEAKKRWGNTDAYKQSMGRTKNWTKEDYKRIQEGGTKLTQQLADVMEKGFKSKEAQDLIEKHHQGIEMFYTCLPEMYRGLASMYVSDARFTAFYDKFKPGLAVWMQHAINYYCDIKDKKDS